MRWHLGRGRAKGARTRDARCLRGERHRKATQARTQLCFVSISPKVFWSHFSFVFQHTTVLCIYPNTSHLSVSLNFALQYCRMHNALSISGDIRDLIFDATREHTEKTRPTSAGAALPWYISRSIAMCGYASRFLAHHSSGSIASQATSTDTSLIYEMIGWGKKAFILSLVITRG